MQSLEKILEAYECSEFFLEYMPTMALASGECVGAEALIRWKHDDELVAPLESIPIVENTPMSGLIT